MNDRILIIDDDKELCALLKKTVFTEDFDADLPKCRQFQG